MRIGFIGAGLMGRGVVLNLMKAGHEVRVIAHRNRAPIEELVGRGAREASSLEELAQGTEIIMLCLTTSTVVAKVVGELTPFLKSGQILIDTGTSDPEATRRLAHQLAAIGVGFADAPMTGGPAQAEAAQVGIMLGADETVHAR